MSILLKYLNKTLFLNGIDLVSKWPRPFIPLNKFFSKSLKANSDVFLRKNFYKILKFEIKKKAFLWVVMNMFDFNMCSELRTFKIKNNNDYNIDN